MNARRTSQIASAVVILGAALLAGTWGYNQTLQPNQTDSTEISPAPIYPAGYSPVKIDHPPQRQEKALKQAAATANKTPDPLSQVWEFNAQQPPELLAQPLTEPNWYITGVGPCNWAQPPTWPCADEDVLSASIFPEAGFEFRCALTQENDKLQKDLQVTEFK